MSTEPPRGIWPIPGSNMLPIKHHAQAWTQGSLGSEPQQILCLIFPIRGSRDYVSKKPVDGVFYISQSPLCPPCLLHLVNQVPKALGEAEPLFLFPGGSQGNANTSCTMGLGPFCCNLS